MQPHTHSKHLEVGHVAAVVGVILPAHTQAHHRKHITMRVNVWGVLRVLLLVLLGARTKAFLCCATVMSRRLASTAGQTEQGRVNLTQIFRGVFANG